MRHLKQILLAKLFVVCGFSLICYYCLAKILPGTIYKVENNVWGFPRMNYYAIKNNIGSLNSVGQWNKYKLVNPYFSHTVNKFSSGFFYLVYIIDMFSVFLHCKVY